MLFYNKSVCAEITTTTSTTTSAKSGKADNGLMVDFLIEFLSQKFVGYHLKILSDNKQIVESIEQNVESIPFKLKGIDSTYWIKLKKIVKTF